MAQYRQYETICDALGLSVGPNPIPDKEFRLLFEECKRITAERSSSERIPPVFFPDHTGMKRSDETKRRISEALKGNTLSEEHKARISSTMKIKLTPEWKAKMAVGRKGVPKSEEHKELVRKANKAFSTICPHCNKSGGHGMFRWHFDNCRMK